jgi:AraC family transcriptional regulator
MRLLSGQWYGNTLNEHCIDGLTLSETSYISNLKLPRHSHERSYFCLVVKGAYTERYYKTEQTCKASTLIFHPEDESHSDYFHADSRCFNIQMDDRWVERMRQHSKIRNDPGHFRSGLLPQLAARLYDEFRKADEFSPMIIEGIALEMMGEAGRYFAKPEDSVPQRWLEKVRDLLHERFTERLSLRQQADYVGVHPVHLAREFRRFYHCTPGEYIRQLRIEFACEKLINSETPLCEIALDAGFFDQSHFTRTFKQFTKKTPQEYRAFFLKQ